jgi:hypothetical protein
LQLHVRRDRLDGFDAEGQASRVDRVRRMQHGGDPSCGTVGQWVDRGSIEADGSAAVGSWVVLPLTVAALAVCWLLAWLALLGVFTWLVRRRADAATLRVLVRLAQTWRMPGGPFHVLEEAALRRRPRDRDDEG